MNYEGRSGENIVCLNDKLMLYATKALSSSLDNNIHNLAIRALENKVKSLT